MITIRVPKTFRIILYLTFFISFVTGILFFCLKTWFFIQGEFGPETHPWQFLTLQVHAASAFIFLLVFGAMLGSHVLFGLRSKRSLKTGISLLVFISIQIITAYLLYYASNDEFRKIIEWVHLIIGSSLPIFLICHIFFGRLKKKKASA